MNHEKSAWPRGVSYRSLCGARRWSVNVKQSWGLLLVMEGRRVAGLRLLQFRRVTWRTVNKRQTRAWGGWLRNIECNENSGGLIPCVARKWLKKSHNGFLCDLNQKSNACNDFNTGGVSSGPKAHLLAIIPFGLMLLPRILGSTQRAFPSFSDTNKKMGI